jgi:hypothetical protein
MICTTTKHNAACLLPRDSNGTKLFFEGDKGHERCVREERKVRTEFSDT